MLRQPIQIIEELRTVYQHIAETLLQELRLADPSSPRLRVPTMRHSHVSEPRVRHGAVTETGITEAVSAALPGLPETFTVHEVMKAMLASDYEFGNDNPRAAVSGVLLKLTRKHRLVLIRKGTGGKASIYKRWE